MVHAAAHHLAGNSYTMLGTMPERPAHARGDTRGDGYAVEGIVLALGAGTGIEKCLPGMEYSPMSRRQGGPEVWP